MQVKGLFLSYKKSRRLMQYFFKLREMIRRLQCTEYGTVPWKMSRDNRINCSHRVRVDRSVCHEDTSLSLLRKGNA